MSNEAKVDVGIDINAPIDFEFIKSEIAEKGPIRLSKPHLPIETMLNIKPCTCLDNKCTNSVVYVERNCGVSRIIWLIEPEELQQFENLNTFSDWVFQFGLANSRGERMIMERAIENLTGSTYHHVETLFCACSNCMKAVGPELVWKNVILTNIAINLQQRREWMKWLEEEFTGDDTEVAELFEDMFELGYQTARMYGEFQLKEELEVPALVGMKAKKDQEKRAEAAGKASQEKRDQRVVALLEKMEAIAERNPDIKRLGPRALADLALSDAIHEEPVLWKQGKGRRDEYLDEMKADLRYRKRFKTIFNIKTV